MSAATRRSSSGSSGEISRPSNSWPPWQRWTWPPSAARSSSGQSTIGGSAAVAGSPSRIAAGRRQPPRSTTAFVKCVVPIITACTRGDRDARRVDERAQRRDDAAGDVRASSAS